MSNVIRLWDTLFSDQDRFNFMNYVAVAIVKSKRKIILHGDFAECMETLQRATQDIQDVKELLLKAMQIYENEIKYRENESKWINIETIRRNFLY